MTPAPGLHEYFSAGIASASAMNFDIELLNCPRNSGPNSAAAPRELVPD
jgi:hypothetical protein